MYVSKTLKNQFEIQINSSVFDNVIDHNLNNKNQENSNEHISNTSNMRNFE